VKLNRLPLPLCAQVPSLYPIIVLPAGAIEQTEAMGTKQKFWFEHEELGLCLFKFSRPDAGEDWAEKVAEQLAGQLGMPHARYELGEYLGRRGVVSPRFLGSDETLIPGNQLLVATDPSYPVFADRARLSVPQHTVAAVAAVLAAPDVEPPEGFVAGGGIERAWDVFGGYLMLDALIGNTDRHHENWALVERVVPGREPLRRLAPTHDHGSSLGRNEQEERVRERLRTTDAGFTPEAYARRAVSKLYGSGPGSKPMLTIDAFREAGRRAPSAAKGWLARLDRLVPEEIAEVLARVPTPRISSAASEFARRILVCNRERLLELNDTY
jgi:hypothetical protein